jgi:hypothetical protein
MVALVNTPMNLRVPLNAGVDVLIQALCGFVDSIKVNMWMVYIGR